MIDPQRILDAQSLLARYFGPTRIARAASLSSPARNVFLKIETGLPTGSFKVRGALYALSLKLAGRDGLKAVPYVQTVAQAVPQQTLVGDGLQAVPKISRSSARAPATTARRSPTRRNSSVYARPSSCPPGRTW
jgi:hypothetical protein